MEPEQCDFCDSRETVWRYRAEDFMVQGELLVQGQHVSFPWGSAGDWAACETCSAMIEADDYDALADRSVATSPFLSLLRENEIPVLRVAVKQLHQEFKKRRIGHRMHDWSMPERKP